MLTKLTCFFFLRYSCTKMFFFFIVFIHRKAWGGCARNYLNDVFADYYSQADLCQRNWIVPHNRILQQHRHLHEKKNPHCEPRSNKMCHCCGGKLRIGTFPGTLPPWNKCWVIGLYLTGSIWEIGQGGASVEAEWRRWQRSFTSSAARREQNQKTKRKKS